MEAKDWGNTITKTNAYNCHNTLEERLAEQVKITGDIAFKAGERKVVEFLDWHSTPYQTYEGSPIIEIQISEVKWQEFLKGGK